MGIQSELFVASSGEAESVASAGLDEGPWTRVDISRLLVDDLATIHCLLDGDDPEAPESFERYLASYQEIGEFDEVLIYQLPHVFVNKIVALDSTKASEVARRWISLESSKQHDGSTLPADVALEYVESLMKIARMASEQRQDILLRLCP